jgi:hypothetical protein
LTSVVNLATAKTLGLAYPESFLLRANEVTDLRRVAYQPMQCGVRPAYRDSKKE